MLSLEKHDVELGDFYEGVKNLHEVIGECELNITFDAFNSGSDYFIAVSYYSSKIGKTIMLDMDVAGSFESNEELADALLRYESESHEIEAKI